MRQQLVHCRTGSLEKIVKELGHLPHRSLPHRQLRNLNLFSLYYKYSSLPHRQLRNSRAGQQDLALSSLPHRQLRNLSMFHRQVLYSSLPHRQLRKQSGRGSFRKRRSLPHRQLRNSKSIEARHRGGSARNSDEVSVMGMELRGWHVQNRSLVNQRWVELATYANLILCEGHEEPYEARVLRTVLWEAEGVVP